MKFPYLVVILLTFSLSSHAEKSMDTQELLKNNIGQLEEELQALRVQVKHLNTQINQSEQRVEITASNLRSDLSRIEENSGEQFLRIDNELDAIDVLKSELGNTNNQVSSVEASVKEISLAWAQSSNIAKIGAIILLSGLLIEIIGATVLAGTHLVTEQKEVNTLKSTPPSNDLSMIDVNSEPRIDFLGSIASFMLFSGFVLQFSGTILILSLPSWLVVIMVALAVIPGTLVICYLLGQSYNQSRTQKIRVILKNIKRNLIPSFGAKCEICSKSLKFHESYVFWSQEPNSEKHPYLYTPHNMHLGHQDCLASSGKYEQSQIGVKSYKK
ncbi:hypothetical protein [Microbulbifer sp. ANSA005]|uniref:hypothetical protein n=1 Tax=Microbulbifer sp. ANSA005 TaxID=3243362 RepID=UPI004041EF26